MRVAVIAQPSHTIFPSHISSPHMKTLRLTQSLIPTHSLTHSLSLVLTGKLFFYTISPPHSHLLSLTLTYSTHPLPPPPLVTPTIKRYFFVLSTPHVCGCTDESRYPRYLSLPLFLSNFGTSRVLLAVYFIGSDFIGVNKILYELLLLSLLSLSLTFSPSIFYYPESLSHYICIYLISSVWSCCGLLGGQRWVREIQVSKREKIRGRFRVVKDRR